MANIHRLDQIALVKETTKGTLVTPSSGDWQPHLGYDYGKKTEKMKDTSAIGRVEEINGSAVDKEWSEGSIPMHLTKDYVGEAMNLLFGQAPTTTGSGPYTHAWTVSNDNDHVSYSVQVNDKIRGAKGYAGCMLKELSWDFSVDDIAKMTLSMEGQKEEAGGGTPAYGADYDPMYFVPKEITYKIATNVAGLGSATAQCFTGFTMTGTKNTDRIHKLGCESPEIVNQQFGIGGTLSEVFDDTTLFDLAHTHAYRALQIIISDGTNSLTMTFPEVQFENATPDTDNNSYRKISVDFFATLDTTNGMVTASLVNSESSY